MGDAHILGEVLLVVHRGPRVRTGRRGEISKGVGAVRAGRRHGCRRGRPGPTVRSFVEEAGLRRATVLHYDQGKGVPPGNI